MSKALDERRWLRRGEKTFAALTRSERDDVLGDPVWKKHEKLIRRERERWWFFKTPRGWVGNRRKGTVPSACLSKAPCGQEEVLAKRPSPFSTRVVY